MRGRVVDHEKNMVRVCMPLSTRVSAFELTGKRNESGRKSSFFLDLGIKYVSSVGECEGIYERVRSRN